MYKGEAKPFPLLAGGRCSCCLEVPLENVFTKVYIIFVYETLQTGCDLRAAYTAPVTPVSIRSTTCRI